jgi:hypothetical protein
MTVPLQVWRMTVAHSDLVVAINAARYRPSRRRYTGALRTDIVIAACPAGLSIRSHNRGMDIPAQGTWTSPLAVNGAWLKRLAPKLIGPDIQLTYADGELALNQTRLSAREI